MGFVVVVVVVGAVAVGFFSCGGPASVVDVEPTAEPSAVPVGNVTVVFPVVWACAGSANMSPVAIARYVLRRIDSLHIVVASGFASEFKFGLPAHFIRHFDGAVAAGLVVVVAPWVVCDVFNWGGPASVVEGT